MKEFFLENWKFLLEILLLVISTVIVIVKRVRKVKVPESDLANMLNYIPGWIVEAEDKFGSGNGDLKFSYVYNKAVDFLCESLDVSVRDFSSSLLIYIKDFIEKVLAAPQKKEEVYEER